MKNKNTKFAAFNAKEQHFDFRMCGIFIAINSAIIGYQPLVDCCTSKVGDCSLARIGEDSLSHFKYLIFRSQMPKNNEIASKANNSNRTSTSTGTKSVELSKIFRPEYLEFTNQLAIIGKWFVDKQDSETDDYLQERYANIENHLSQVAYEIGLLVSSDFKENVYYNLNFKENGDE
ncbi:MAG: hypothetical protein LBO74_08565 [Candidatus Symbiothrix sp.]|nr:hypothetical protein [Candidatus Symbiothrix sp.]